MSAVAALRDELERLDQLAEDLPEQIHALQAEYDKIDRKKTAILSAVKVLEGMDE